MSYLILVKYQTTVDGLYILVSVLAIMGVLRSCVLVALIGVLTNETSNIISIAYYVDR